MNCKAVSQILSSYLDGEVSSADSQKVRAHLHDCQECENELRQLTVVRSIMKLEPREVNIPVGLEQRLAASVQRPKKRFVLATALASVAVVASLLVPAMTKSAAHPTENSRSQAMRKELARDQMAAFGTDPTEGASLTHYASFKEVGR